MTDPHRDQAVPTRQIRIEHLGGSSREGRVETFARDHVRIGRRADNDVVFDPHRDPLVSGLHAELRIDRDGLVVADSGSTNGTLVNGRPVKIPTRLGPNDRVSLGPGGPEFTASLSPAGEKASVGMATMVGFVEKERKRARARTLRVALPLLLLCAGAFTAVLALREARDAPGAVAWESVLGPSRSSVYVVVLQGDVDGKTIESASGTAWSVAPGLLATNAHVADQLEGSALIARSSDPLPVDLRIIGARVHPGYRQFDDLLETYRPFDFNGGAFLSLTNPYDVALLRLHPEDVARQAAPLELAPLGVLTELGAGAQVAMIGFPVEGRVGGGTDVDQPEPDQRAGTVARMSNVFFGRAEDPSHALVLSYTFASAGGASGSPVFDRRNRVVGLISSGDVLGSMGAGRIQGLGTYGPRVDLVRELVEDRADAAQARRREELEAGFLNRFRDGIENPKPLARMFFDSALRSSEVAYEEIEILEESEVVLSAAGRSRRQRVPTLRIPAPGVYMVFVAARDFPVPLRALISTGGGVAEEVNDDSYFVYTAANLSRRTTMDVEVFAESDQPIPETRVAVVLLRATR